MVKKKIKKISLATILLLFAHNVWAYDFESGGLYYNITSNTTVAVTYKDNNYNSYSGNITIPATVLYNNITYSVTSIGKYAFYGCDGLTTIVVDSGNPKYDSRDNCNAIIETATNTLIVGCKNTIIPNSVKSIGELAFSYCTGLTSVTIPNSVKSIGDNAFYGCTGLTSVTIPNSVTSIGNKVFSYCIGLTSVTLGNSVTSIGNVAFLGCIGLDSIVVDSGNPKYDSRDNCNAIIETATNTLIVGCKNTIIPNSVTSIWNGAFSDCSGLTSVTIPNSVTSIGNSAFEGCSGLTSVTIPNSVTSIGNSAFEGCSGLTSVTFLGSNTSVESSYTFKKVLTSIPIYIPCGSLSWYSNQEGLSRFSNKIEQFSYKYTVSSQDTTMGNVASTTTPTCIYYTWTISATANYGYHFTQWSDGDTTNPRTIQVLSDTILIAYFTKETTGIEDVSDVNNAVHLYPNPAKTMLTIENATEDVQIFDITGRMLMSIENKETNLLQINVSNLSKGMYFVKVGNYITKFVKE